MPITASSALANIGQGLSEDIAQVHDELAWIEERALDAGNTNGDTMLGPLTVPQIILGGSSVNPNSMFYYGSDKGTVNSLTVTTTFPNAMSKGLQLAVLIGTLNTSACTLNVNGLGAYSILQGGNVLSGGELPAKAWVLFEFDGTYWNIIGPPPGGNPNQTFLGADSTSATQQFVPRAQADSLYAPVAGGGAVTMVFFNATAPTGWTQVTTVNDQVLRVVNGVGGGSGGSWSVSGFTAANHSHDLGNHTHTEEGIGDNVFSAGGGGGDYTGSLINAGSQQTGVPSSNASGATSPNVTNDGNWRPAYINVILASKN